MYILGISAFYHDSAATLLKDDVIIAAVQEERFTRIKQDSAFPVKSIEYCLKEANITLADIDHIAFYEKPFLKFERLLETYVSEAPRGFSSFIKAIPIWLKEKLFLKQTLIREFKKIEDISDKDLLTKILFGEHHQSHAASAYFPSPYDESAILTIDGTGEWSTTSLWYGKGNSLKLLKEINFPHSLGLLYSAFTYYTGFKVNSGEYKVMGLAPYGEPKYVELIKEKLIDIKADGSFRMDMQYFNYLSGLTMTNKKFDKIFGEAPRQGESEIDQRVMDLARSIQDVTEEVMLKLASYAKELTGSNNLCLAGGVALNCVGNGRILREGIIDNLWIQPAAGDAGGSLGVAYSVYYQHLDNERIVDKTMMDKMQGSYLGPQSSQKETITYLDSVNAKYHKVLDEEFYTKVATALNSDKVVGWHQGRMEFGPRSLGARSILGDARSINMQQTMNLKIKYRESFRPFAPSVLAEDVTQYFDLNCSSPYMLLVAPIQKSLTTKMSVEEEKLFGIDKLNIIRSKIPAVTHVDYSARVQTVHEESNPRYYNLIKKFKELSGSSVLVNTSFNVRGEPIVCTPEDSYRCFMRTEMDLLVIDDFIIYKDEQPTYKDSGDWQDEFELD